MATLTTEDRTALTDSLRRLLGDHSTEADVRRAMETPEGYDPADYEGYELDEKIVKDPTGSRGKKPLVMAVKFHGGADRMIVRGFPESAGGLLTIRISKD